MKLTHIPIILLSLIIISCNEDSLTNNQTNITVSTSDFTATIDENPSINQIIGIIEGTTNEGNVEFSIIEQSPNNSLEVNQLGILSVSDNSLFDYETNPIITAVVKVANGSVFSYSNVSITLNNIPIEFTDIINGIENGTSLAVNGDYLYIAHSNKVSKINVVDYTGNLIEVIDNLDSPKSMVFKGNDLYITEGYMKISKIDVTNPIHNTFYEGTGYGINQITLLNDDLYYGVSYDDYGFIYEINTINTPPAPSYVASGGNSISSLSFHNSFLYNTYYDAGYQPIQKIDFSNSPTSISTIYSSSHTSRKKITIKNDYLYYSVEGNIYKINLNDSSSSPINVFSFPPTYSNPQNYFSAITFHGNNLYLLNANYNKIVKLNLD